MKVNKMNDEKVAKLIHKIGLKYNLRDITTKDICEAQFKFTYDKMRSLPLEEGNINKNISFYFKYIGKLYINKKK